MPRSRSVLDVPIGTVMSRISRGRRALYERLARAESGRGCRRRARAEAGDVKAELKCRSGAAAMSKCQDLEPLLAPYVDGGGAAPSVRIGRGTPRTLSALPRTGRRTARRRATCLRARRASACVRARPSTFARGARRMPCIPAAGPSSALRPRAGGCRCRSLRRSSSPSQARSCSASTTGRGARGAADARSHEVFPVRARAPRRTLTPSRASREWAGDPGLAAADSRELRRPNELELARRAALLR